LLGTDDVLCLECAKLWFDEGVTSREDMRRLRHAGAAWLEARAYAAAFARE
jgi:hypothetical protein